jgi:hypothetical protein
MVVPPSCKSETAVAPRARTLPVSNPPPTSGGGGVSLLLMVPCLLCLPPCWVLFPLRCCPLRLVSWSFHPCSTPRAVACEAGRAWCVVRALVGVPGPWCSCSSGAGSSGVILVSGVSVQASPVVRGFPGVPVVIVVLVLLSPWSPFRVWSLVRRFCCRWVSFPYLVSSPSGCVSRLLCVLASWHPSLVRRSLPLLPSSSLWVSCPGRCRCHHARSLVVLLGLSSSLSSSLLSSSASSCGSLSLPSSSSASSRCPGRHSTHNPPHEQLLVRLGVVCRSCRCRHFRCPRFVITVVIFAIVSRSLSSLVVVALTRCPVVSFPSWSWGVCRRYPVPVPVVSVLFWVGCVVGGGSRYTVSAL